MFPLAVVLHWMFFTYVSACSCASPNVLHFSVFKLLFHILRFHIFYFSNALFQPVTKDRMGDNLSLSIECWMVIFRWTSQLICTDFKLNFIVWSCRSMDWLLADGSRKRDDSTVGRWPMIRGIIRLCPSARGTLFFSQAHCFFYQCAQLAHGKIVFKKIKNHANMHICQCYDLHIEH